MFRSKAILQLSLSGLALLALSACNLPTPQKVDIDDTASYFVSHTDGKFTTTTNHPNVSLPLAKTMSLSACLKESSRSRAILSHRFVIKGGAKDLAITTDSQGCLIWEEELPFNYLADEEYVTIERVLHPEGVQTGDRKVEFIVNPWSSKIYSALDSRVKNPVPVEKASLSLQGSTQKERRSLWLDWVRLNVMQEKISGQRGSYVLEVSATLLMERMDERKERQLIPVAYGKIDGRIRLICTMSPDGRDPMRVVIAQMDHVKAEVVNGNKVFLNSKFTLTEYCPTTAFLMAGVSVSIENGPALLAPFHGLYHGGPAQNMVGPMFSAPDGTFMDRFMKDKTYTIDRWLSENKAIYRNGTKPLPGMHGEPTLAGGPQGQIDPAVGPSGVIVPMEQNPDASSPDMLQKFRVEVRELQGMSYGFQNQFTKNRTLTYRVRACLRLGIDQQAMRAITFTVHKVNGKSDRITTLDDGCLEFEDNITYNHYANECWFEKSVRLENKDYGFNESFKVQINPWSRGSQWFKDVRWLPNTDRVARCANRPSQILLDSYFMEASGTRYQYSLDEQLNLNQKRQANIAVRPQLYRAAFDTSTGYVTENLPAGKYLLRYALVDQSVQDFSNAGALKDRIYAVDRTVISVREDGQIIDQVRFSLPTESLISLNLLNQFVVEIMPLREDLALAPDVKGRELERYVDYEHAIQTVPFVAAFIHRGEGGGLRKLESHIGKSLVLELEKPYLRAQAEISASQVKSAKKEVIARLNGLDLIDLSKEASSQEFRTKLSQSLPNFIPNARRNEQPPVAPELLKSFFDTGKMDRSLAVKMCGYIFRQQWTQNLPGKSHGLLDAKDEGERVSRLYDLQADCVKNFDTAQSEAFDIEYQYLMKNPKLVGKETCARDENGQQQCATEIAPDRVDVRGFSVGNSFSLSRSYGVHEGYALEGQVELGISKYLGIGVGGGYQIGSSENLGQSNSVSFSQDMSLNMETLQFRVRAQDAERCVMVRVNPMLFDREDPGFWGWSFTEKRSVFARYLNPDLTDRERWAARQKGVLICEGKFMGRSVDFVESFYMVRPSSPVGMLGDEKSRASVEGLFTTMRGVNDMTSFMARVTYSDKIPASFQRELQARQLDTTRLREAFLRGSRAMPGVYSTVKPLK